MPLSPKNWPLNSYTDATWTDLVAEASVLSTLLISSSAPSSVTVEVRLSDGAGTGLATLVQPSKIEQGQAWTLDLRSLCVTGSQSIQVRADIPGAEFLASGGA